MSRYKQNSIPHAVVMRMHPEDVGVCYDADIGVDAVAITPPGEKPLPNALFIRGGGKDNRNPRYYFNEAIGGRPKIVSTRCRANDRDGAIAWVLARLAQLGRAGWARMAPENIPACEIFAEYAVLVKAQLDRGEIKVCTATNYLDKLRLLGTAHRYATIADLSAAGARVMLEWCHEQGYSRNTAVDCNNVAKRAVNIVMRQHGSAYRLDFHVGQRKPRGKKPFEPDESDRIMDRINNGTIYGEDKQPLIRWDEDLQAHVPVLATREQMLAAIPFQTAVPFMLETGTRHEAACQVTFTEPSGPYIDLDGGILHRRGEMTEDNDIKRRGSCVMSSRYMGELRPLAEKMLDAGITHLIHDRRGNPVRRLDIVVWRQILKDAQVPYRVIHCLKDTAIQIARREKVSIYDAAERFATTVETLQAFYGADWDLGNQIDAAEAQGEQKRWRASFEAAKERRERAATARARRVEDAPRKPRVAKVQVPAAASEPKRPQTLVVAAAGGAAEPEALEPMRRKALNSEAVLATVHDALRLARRKGAGRQAKPRR